MSRLIYYPSFEPSEDWLKYALIYVDKFSPIIPERGEDTLSDSFKKAAETDLIQIYQPEYMQGENASTKALHEIERIESHPERYRDILKSPNIDRKWKDPNNWISELYWEKYSNNFKEECIRKGLGKETDKGLLTSKELIQLYMTFLAEEIAYYKEGNPITDISEFDQFTDYLRARRRNTEDVLNAAKTIVNITLPEKLNNIKIDKIIEFRNDSGIKELRKAFNDSVTKFYETVEGKFDPGKYLETIKKSNFELTKEVGVFFGATASAIMGATLLLTSPNQPSNLEVAKQILDGSLVGITGYIAINKAWSEGKEQRHARKFVKKISQIL